MNSKQIPVDLYLDSPLISLLYKLWAIACKAQAIIIRQYSFAEADRVRESRDVGQERENS